MLTTAVIELMQQFIMLQKLLVSQCGQHLRRSAIADKIKTTVSDEVNYRGTQS